MEFGLRCNVLKCRKEVGDHAMVTTCSHVFCIDCANRSGLASVRDGQRPICPACDVQLSNPDDAVVANLNPTEDYKTSVLSGLSPNVIMECAGRALNFWAYQTTQEIVYQEYLAKNLTDKYTTLNTQVDKIVHDANGEISNLRNRISSLQVDQDTLRRKNEEVMQALREKNRKHLQTQELYDKLKRRAMLGHVQDAAHDAVDHTILASAAANHFVDKADNHNTRPPPPPPLFSGQQSNGMQRSGSVGGPGAMNAVPHHTRAGRDTGWAGFSSQGNSTQNRPMQTPSSHRQQMASFPIGRPNNGVSGNSQPRLSPRQPLGNLNGNTSGFTGYGMSAGLKVSNPTGGRAGVMGRPVIGSRVAHRTGSAFSNHQNSAYGPSSTNMFSSGGNLY
ncbi:uncharacterized protein L3040_004971 [Drepanopeziza brunnea f. sp. 'multigermtubi']|uniref:uncharacterized protein n=1 Tax=Drepanopeziza brunnea f. sp. 'multigermtubi' TaxID=698441 RepID=UPI002381EF4F|nr:hypothetical protein L3040_004971 [Drepanopeziza brunnea f. sp. 'multigermtubi']